MYAMILSGGIDLCYPHNKHHTVIFIHLQLVQNVGSTTNIQFDPFQLSLQYSSEPTTTLSQFPISNGIFCQNFYLFKQAPC